MTIPGYTAEASFSKWTEQYHAAATKASGGDALWPANGFDIRTGLQQRVADPCLTAWLLCGLWGSPDACGYYYGFCVLR